MDRNNTPLIVITGPTGSGKTGLAIELAEKYGGEIVCADSRTIYKGMDIGTAKPTAEEQARVPHYLLDVVEPGERYTAADFQTDAYRMIDAIWKRGNVPFLVGGTGLYIDAVVREYEWPEWSDNKGEREELEALSVEDLQVMIKKQQLVLPTNTLNKRHLINTLIREGQTGEARLLPRENTHVVAIATPKAVLEARIIKRAQVMFDSGVVDEAETLVARYGWDSEAMTGNIYPIVKKVIEGEINKQQAIELFITKDKQLAKRQVTWLKRHDYVQWYSLDDARVFLEQILSP